MTGWMRNVFNVPGMIPAAVITYGGMTDAYGISAPLIGAAASPPALASISYPTTLL
jgi:hypothetical protein